MKFSSRMIVAALSLFICPNLLSQEAAPVVVLDGELTGVTKEVGRLIHLSWSKGRLVIDRDHWMKSTGSKTDAEKAEDAIQAMVKRGIPEEIARKMADRGGGGPFGGGDFLTNSSEGQLFTELKAASGAMSGGGGGGGDERHWRGHGENVYLGMNTKNSTKDFRFMMREAASPAQEILVEEHQEKGLRIQFNSPTRNLVFVSGKDGEIQVAHTSTERSEAFRAKSYEQMLELQPAFAAEFGVMLDQLGINRPLTDHDPRVLTTIGKLVLKPSSETSKAANATIAKLNDDAYRVRDAAEKEVAANFVAWRSLIREKLERKDLASEVRLRLESVLASSTFDSSEAEDYIEERKLLRNAEYLNSTLPEVPESLRDSIQQHIDSLETTK